MRTYDNIDLTLVNAFDRLGDFLAGFEAGQFGQAYRPVSETVTKGLKMLFGQQRGRRQQCYLFTACDRHEGSTQRHFGFTKTDIATHQPVHGRTTHHVTHDRFNGSGLICRFLKAKAFAESFIVMPTEFKFMPLA